MITWIIIGIVVAIIFRRYIQGPICKIEKDLTSQIVIVTGSNTGIGADTVRRLAELGATIILANRSKERTLPIL